MSAQIKTFSQKMKEIKTTDLVSVWKEFKAYVKENLGGANDSISRLYNPPAKEVLKDQVNKLEKELVSIWSEYENGLNKTYHSKLDYWVTFLDYAGKMVSEARDKFIKALDDYTQKLVLLESSLSEYRTESKLSELSGKDDENIKFLDSAIREKQLSELLTVSTVKDLFEKKNRKITNTQAVLYMQYLAKMPEYRYEELGENRKPALYFKVKKN